MPTITEYIEMSNAELMELYHCRNGDGESAGSDPGGNPSEQSVTDAVAAEGWDVVRDISDRPDVETLLARDGDALYIVSDVNGPWAIQLTFADGEDRLDARPVEHTYTFWTDDGDQDDIEANSL